MTLILELRRLSDDLVYRFHHSTQQENHIFLREDRDVYLSWREDFGWGVWDGDTLQGRPWDIPLDLQNHEAPPEGLWVSQKGIKSYCYKLVHLSESKTGEVHV